MGCLGYKKSISKGDGKSTDTVCWKFTSGKGESHYCPLTDRFKLYFFIMACSNSPRGISFQHKEYLIVQINFPSDPDQISGINVENYIRAQDGHDFLYTTMK